MPSAPTDEMEDFNPETFFILENHDGLTLKLATELGLQAWAAYQYRIEQGQEIDLDAYDALTDDEKEAWTRTGLYFHSVITDTLTRSFAEMG